jgi:hypothetical protein
VGADPYHQIDAIYWLVIMCRYRDQAKCLQVVYLAKGLKCYVLINILLSNMPSIFKDIWRKLIVTILFCCYTCKFVSV